MRDLGFRLFVRRSSRLLGACHQVSPLSEFWLCGKNRHTTSQNRKDACVRVVGEDMKL